VRRHGIETQRRRPWGGEKSILKKEGGTDALVTSYRSVRTRDAHKRLGQTIEMQRRRPRAAKIEQK
jgi:hypothetical protein